MDYQTRQHVLRPGMAPTSIVTSKRRTRKPRRMPTLPGWATGSGANVNVTATWLVMDGVGSVAVASGSVEATADGYVVYRVSRGTTTGAYVFRATPPEATNAEYLEWPVCRVTLVDDVARVQQLHVGVYFFASVTGGP